MATTDFVDESTVIEADWLNDVDAHVYSTTPLSVAASTDTTMWPVLAGSVSGAQAALVSVLLTYNATTGIMTTPGFVTTATAALTTAAEAWVGPSSTLGVYFKSGNGGTGTTDPQSQWEVRGPIGTGATPAGILTLSTKETTIIAGDQLGRINFLAPEEASGTDAILPGAAIWAEAEDTFTASVNSIAIVFGTATTSVPVERGRLTSGGAWALTEMAAADTDVAGRGQTWVKNTTPNEFWFTNDAGTDLCLSGEQYTAASTACTGAITTACVWKLTKTGNVVTLTLPAVQGNGVATTNFTVGLTIPADYRPAADIASVSAPIINNAANQSAPGAIKVTSAGVISVWLNGTFSGNFTVTANAGLAYTTSVRWTI
jgi:hypothetical protein